MPVYQKRKSNDWINNSIKVPDNITDWKKYKNKYRKYEKCFSIFPNDRNVHWINTQSVISMHVDDETGKNTNKYYSYRDIYNNNIMIE